MTTSTTPAPPETPAAPEARPGEFAIVLPPGLGLEDLSDPSDTPDAATPAAEPAPAATPAPETSAEPAAPAPKRTGDPRVPIRALRDENRRLKREIQQLRTAPPPVLPVLTDKDWEDLEPKVEASGSLTKGVRAVWEHATQRAATTRQSEAQRTKAQTEQEHVLDRVRRSQEAFRQTHSDFDRRVIESGLMDEVNEGGELAWEIWRAPDPAAYAYQKATERLTELGLLDEEPAAAAPSPSAPAASARAAAPAAAVPAPATVPATTLSPAAARVVEEMVKTQAPPRGVRSLPSAGGFARAAMTDADLYRLRDSTNARDNERFVAIVKANPDLERRLLGG